jgi:hypothetical protein
MRHLYKSSINWFCVLMNDKNEDEEMKQDGITAD